jgi:hypothetical protein
MFACLYLGEKIYLFLKIISEIGTKTTTGKAHTRPKSNWDQSYGLELQRRHE